MKNHVPEWRNERFCRGLSLAQQIVGAAVASVAIISLPATSFADENGISFWLPGIYGSLAAVPQQPGWSFAAINYYDSVGASGSVAASREITIGRLSPTVNVNLNVSVKADIDVALLYPSYVFATPVFGGQLTVGGFGIVGVNSTALDGTLTLASGPFVIARQGSISQTATGVGDLYPVTSLRWNSGVNNWMVYGTGDIPVGQYSPANLANFGIGHGAADLGGGYSYFDPKLGHEFSAVTGFTYNLINPSTNYQNGIDWHLDWGASQFVSKQVFFGAVGYFYEQVTPDGGSGDHVGSFESGVIGVGPQMGVIVPLGQIQAYLNLKAYWEFDGHDRPSGWNTWLTLSFSPSAPTNPRSAMLTK
ncbi:MAG: transporter [Xanthobacteraceae bacterium]